MTTFIIVQEMLTRSGKFKSNSGSTTCIFLLLVCLCLSAPVKAQERTIGHVLDIEGDWFLNSQKKSLSKNDELPASGVIRIPSPSRFAFIVIRYSANNQIVSKRCRNPGECDQPILLPRAVERQVTIREYLFDQAMRILRLNLITPSVHSGRSDDGVLREAVVPINNGQVDLASVFAEMNDGSYYVHLQRAPKGKPAKNGSDLMLRWEAGKATTIPDANLQPGLYEIVLLEKSGGEYKPTLTKALFLATNPDRYDHTMSPFLEATKLAATWKDNVSEGTVTDFLRAILFHLESKSQLPKRAK